MRQSEITNFILILRESVLQYCLHRNDKNRADDLIHTVDRLLEREDFQVEGVLQGKTVKIYKLAIIARP